jgi:hypothetical protein
MAVVPNAALVINYPRLGGGGGGGFGGFQQQVNLADALTAGERQLDQIRKMLRDGEAYGRARDAYAKDSSLPRPDINVVLEALVPYVRGQQPVIFRADREAEIPGSEIDRGDETQTDHSWWRRCGKWPAFKRRTFR